MEKNVIIRLSLSEAILLRTMTGISIDNVYCSISAYEDEGIQVPAWLENALKEKSDIYDKIVEAIENYYR